MNIAETIGKDIEAQEKLDSAIKANAWRMFWVLERIARESGDKETRHNAHVAVNRVLTWPSNGMPESLAEDALAALF